MAETLTKAKNAITQAVYEYRLSNDDLVELINHCGDYLNAKSPKEYSLINGCTPQAAHKSKHIKLILGKKFVCDNL
jgi:hypothetical protein